MEKLNVAIADDNERVVSLLEHIVSQDKDLQLQMIMRKWWKYLVR